MSALNLIDNLEFARNFKEIRAIITGCDLSRLTSDGVRLAGGVAYALHGLVDEQGRAVLTLRVQATVNLHCQRCLEEFQQQIDLSERFVVLQSEAEIQALEALQEDIVKHEYGEDGGLDAQWEQEYIAYSDRFNVNELIEDTLLLNIPFSPRHQQGVCSIPDAKVSADVRNESVKPNPFAVLATLKEVKAKD